MIAYADTGFLVSLYSQDAHSSLASALVHSCKPTFILNLLGETEFNNALRLRVFRKEWTPRQSRLVRESFEQHLAAGLFRTEPLTAEVWEKALSLSRRHTAKLGTRTLDVLHVAAALALKPDLFYTFDERQRKLAKAERLNVLPR